MKLGQNGWNWDKMVKLGHNGENGQNGEMGQNGEKVSERSKCEKKWA